MRVKTQGSSAWGSRSLQRGPSLDPQTISPGPMRNGGCSSCLHLWSIPWGLDSLLLFLSFPLSPVIHPTHTCLLADLFA